MPTQRRPLILDVQNVVIKYMDANQRIFLRNRVKYFASVEKKLPLLIKKLEFNHGSWKINNLEYQFSHYRQFQHLTIQKPIKISTLPMPLKEIWEGENAKNRLEKVVKFLEDFGNSKARTDIEKCKRLGEEAEKLRRIVIKFNERKVVSDQKFKDFFVLKIGENNFEEKVLEKNKKLRIRDFSDIRNYFLQKMFDGRNLVTVGTLALNNNSINRTLQGVPELKLRVKKLSLNSQTRHQTNFPDLVILDVRKEDDPINLDSVGERITVDSFPLESVNVSVGDYSNHSMITSARKLIISHGDVIPKNGAMKVFKNEHVHFGGDCQMTFKMFLKYLEGPVDGGKVKQGSFSFITGKKWNFAGFIRFGQYRGKMRAREMFEKNMFPITITKSYDHETDMHITCNRLRFSYKVDIKLTTR